MQFDVVTGISYIFILVILFDISFNLRRLVGSLDRIWRKLAEINDAVKKDS